MAIDSQAKRNSAICTRRLPWFRRFTPVPSGEITQAVRQQVVFVYQGISAVEFVGADTISLYAVYQPTVELVGIYQTTVTLSGGS